MHAIRFLKQFISNPGDVGSITPSSRQLASVVIDAARVRHANVVVEFGPGTGAITKVLVPALRPGAKFFALEINGDFVKLLREQFPGTAVHQDSAENTPKYLNEIGETHCDAIVSGLPWTFFAEPLQDNLLSAATESLREGGLFATYMYVSSMPMPSSIKFRTKLRKRFSQVGMSRIVWRNFPPAIVIWGRK
ncbi:MAG TPA: rRNA adenine N-6-methyltransferase family protein [Candidatus Hydrogenedentes bacterium]|nr:rRNA adenine N-6-methyltransferase family protein [Candidatus Hydrogenedentota bacterium]HRK36644.1 rRNA adenine N-6-methyltransferase family protein [Candidatus Hydrogenedentota bacterium]